MTIAMVLHSPNIDNSLQVQSETKPKYISVPIILLQTPRAEGTPASAAHNEKAHRKEGLKIWVRETDMPQWRNPQAMPQQNGQQYIIFEKIFF